MSPNAFWKNIIWLLVLAVVAAGMIGIFATWYGSRAPAITPETGCRRDGSYPAHVVILIDQSDPFRETDIQWVDRIVAEETRGVIDYGKVTLLALTAQSYEPREVFTRCSPGSPIRVNQSIRNRDFIEIEWRRKLYEPLRAAVGEVLTQRVQARSPLAEALVEIAGRADFTPDVPERRIVIISDLVQNSDDFSFYQSGTASSEFERTAVASRLGELSGVSVRVHIVPRRSYDFSQTRIQTFWRRVLERRNAALEVL